MSIFFNAERVDSPTANRQKFCGERLSSERISAHKNGGKSSVLVPHVVPGARLSKGVDIITANWCGACQASKKTFRGVGEYFYGTVDIRFIDVSDNADLQMRYGIKHFPTVLVTDEQGETTEYVPHRHEMVHDHMIQMIQSVFLMQ